MELFIHPASPNCVATLAVARHLQLAVQVHTVDLMNGEHNGARFRELNPGGLVPVLRDREFILPETVAILSYLADVSPQPRLLSTDAKARADTVRWLSWGLAHWNPALQPFIYERVFKPLKGQGVADEQRLLGLQPKLHDMAAILDRQLAARDFVCGEDLSIADFYLAAFPMYSHSAGIEFEGFGHLSRWLSRIHSMPEWMASLQHGTPQLQS